VSGLLELSLDFFEVILSFFELHFQSLDAALLLAGLALGLDKVFEGAVVVRREAVSGLTQTPDLSDFMRQLEL